MARDTIREVGRASSWRVLWATMNLWLFPEVFHDMRMVSPLEGVLGIRMSKFNSQLHIPLEICN